MASIVGCQASGSSRSSTTVPVFALTYPTLSRRCDMMDEGLSEVERWLKRDNGAVLEDVANLVPGPGQLGCHEEDAVTIGRVELGTEHDERRSVRQPAKFGDPRRKRGGSPYCFTVGVPAAITQRRIGRPSPEVVAEPSVPEAGLCAQLLEALLDEVRGMTRVRFAADVDDRRDPVGGTPALERPEIVGSMADRMYDNWVLRWFCVWHGRSGSVP